MSDLAKTLRGFPKLDPRWFAVFMGLQAMVLAAVLLMPQKILILAGAGIGSGILAILLVLYPWILVPAIVVTTALDISGQLIRTTVLGIPLTGFHLTLGLLVLALLVNTLLRRRIQFPAFDLGGPLFLLIGVMAISLTYSPNQPEATIGFVRTLALTVLLYATTIMINSKPAVTLVVVSMMTAIIGGAVLAIVQVITEKFYLPASFVIAVGANAPRATGTFHNPNTFGTFLMVGVVLIFAVMVNYRAGFWKQLIMLLAFGMGVTGLVITFSRSNWLATMVGVVIVLVLAKKLRYLFIVLVSALVAILAVKEFVPFAEHIFLRFVSIFTIFEEFDTLGRESSSARIYYVLAGLKMFLDNPLLGAGWRAFPAIFDYYKPTDFPFWIPSKESHTLFATILAELGIVGFLASAWIVWRVLSRGFSGLREMQDPYLRAVLIGLLSVFISFQVSLSFTADFNNNFLWFFTGMLFAVIRLDKEAKAA